MKRYLKRAVVSAVAIAGAVLMTLPVPDVSAQDWSRSPLYGSINLNAGFPNDPVMVSLTAGGPINARASLGGSCAGFVASAPDYRIYYNSGSLPLSFYARSGADTTLVVNAPDGRWYCNDDFSGLNPGVQFSRPMSGQYDVWVGTYGSNTAGATLYVSEFSPFSR